MDVNLHYKCEVPVYNYQYSDGLLSNTKWAICLATLYIMIPCQTEFALYIGSQPTCMTTKTALKIACVHVIHTHTIYIYISIIMTHALSRAMHLYMVVGKRKFCFFYYNNEISISISSYCMYICNFTTSSICMMCRSDGQTSAIK